MLRTPSIQLRAPSQKLFPPALSRLRSIVLAACLAGGGISAPAAEPIDWNRARDLYQRSQRGETLNPDEQAYLDRAKQARKEATGDGTERGGVDMTKARELYQRMQRGETLSADERALIEKAREQMQRQRANTGPGGGPKTVPETRSETGFEPLTDMSRNYQDQDSGLYGGGRNEPPPELAEAAKAETARIQPLDAEGRPAAGGKIVLLSLGMSNTTQEFSKFAQMAAADHDKAANVAVVDGAQGGQSADRIANENAPFWTAVDERLRAAGVTPRQVQVVWLKQAIPGPAAGFPAEMRRLKDDIARDLQIAAKRYPNLRIAYLSSRIYAGYAVSPLNPEPYAYESGFAVRWLVQEQLPQASGTERKPPLLLWGPYLWADGEKGRKAGDLVWKREDFGPDGTHPSESGRRKVAEQLLRFFKTDANARTWFLRRD